MLRDLRPITDRANLGYRLRVIRNKIRELQAADPKANAVDIQFLQQTHHNLKRDYIFLIAENNCS